VRAYRPSDRAAVERLVVELQAHEAALFDRMLAPEAVVTGYLDALLQDCAREDGALLVAESGGEIVGYACVLARVPVRERDEMPYTHALVVDLAVARPRRRQGIGRVLLTACEQHARACGARWLRIGTLAANADARRSYQSFGFREHFIEMEKTLDDSETTSP